MIQLEKNLELILNHKKQRILASELALRVRRWATAHGLSYKSFYNLCEGSKFALEYSTKIKVCCTCEKSHPVSIPIRLYMALYISGPALT